MFRFGDVWSGQAVEVRSGLFGYVEVGYGLAV